MSCDGVPVLTASAASGWRAVYLAEDDSGGVVSTLPVAFWLVVVCSQHGTTARPMIATRQGDILEACELTGDGFEVTFLGVIGPEEDAEQLARRLLRDQVARQAAS